MKRRHPDQGVFGLRRYIVRCDGFGDCHVDAATASGAKYRAYKLAREAGYFPEGFRDFLARGFTARADRRALRYGEISPELGL